MEEVVAHHVGDGMLRMLGAMRIPVHVGATGDARTAVESARRDGLPPAAT